MTSFFSSATAYFHPIILLPSGLLLSELTTCGKEHPWLIPRKLGYHPQSHNLGLTMTPITVEEMWRMWWKRETIGTLRRQ